VGILIDTSVLIAGEKANMPLEKLHGSVRAEDCFISSVTASELLVGVHRAINPVVRTRRSVRTEASLVYFGILPIAISTARVRARIAAELSARGTPIGQNDLWIAASAVTHGLAISTLNVREFQRVPGLTVERWAL
jgi:predicted nucleic acid-binding protein